MNMETNENWDDFSSNVYGLLPLTSAMGEFSRLKQENSLIKNIVHTIFGYLKCIPLVGNIAYLAQKFIHYLNSDEILKNSSTSFDSPAVSEKILTISSKMNKIFFEMDFEDPQTPHLAENLFSSMDQELATLNNEDRRAVLQGLIANPPLVLHSFLPEFNSPSLEWFLDELLKKDPTLFKGVIKNSQDARNFASQPSWVVKMDLKAPNLIGECLAHHQDPLSLILSSDSKNLKNIFWNYLKNDIALMGICASKYSISWIYESMRPNSKNIIEEIFSMEDTRFKAAICLFNNRCFRLLRGFVDQIYDSNWSELIESIAKKQPERFHSFVKDNIDDLYKIDDKNIIRLITFALARGGKVLTLIKEKYSQAIKNELIERLQDLQKELITGSDAYSLSRYTLRLIKSIYSFDPALVRNVALKLAQARSGNKSSPNLAIFYLLPDYRSLLCSHQWLLKADPRLFIQLIGLADLSSEVEVTYTICKKEIKRLFVASSFNKHCPVITLDLNDLPTAYELSQFYNNLQRSPLDITLPTLQIPFLPSKQIKEVGNLLASTLKKIDNPAIKVQFTPLTMYFSQPLTNIEDNVNIHPTLLDCFSMTSKKAALFSEKVGNIKDFIYKGLCMLETSEEMSRLLLNCKISYLRKDDFEKLGEEKKKQFGSITFKEKKLNEKIEETFFIHKLLLERYPMFKNLISPESLDMTHEPYMIACDEFSKQACLEALSWLYRNPVDFDRMNSELLLEILAVAQFWGIEDLEENCSVYYLQILEESSEDIKELPLDSRKDLVDFIKQGQRLNFLDALPLLDGLASDERIEVIDLIFDEKTLFLKSSKESPITFAEAICLYTKNMIPNMTAKEQDHTFSRLENAGLSAAFKKSQGNLKQFFPSLIKIRI